MKNAFNRLRSGMETLNLTMLLILNLFFMVFLLLAVCTVLVLAGVDEGFFITMDRSSSVVHWPLSIPSAS